MCQLEVYFTTILFCTADAVALRHPAPGTSSFYLWPHQGDQHSTSSHSKGAIISSLPPLRMPSIHFLLFIRKSCHSLSIHVTLSPRGSRYFMFLQPSAVLASWSFCWFHWSLLYTFPDTTASLSDVQFPRLSRCIRWTAGIQVARSSRQLSWSFGVQVPRPSDALPDLLATKFPDHTEGFVGMLPLAPQAGFTDL